MATQTFDIQLDADGDWPLFPIHVTGTLLVLQRVKIRLATFLGEWLLDASTGLDILRWMGEKPFDIDRAGAEVRLAIETTPGVVRTESFTATFDGPNRSALFTGRVVLEDEVLDFEVAPAGVASLDAVNQTSSVVFFRSGHIVGV